MRKVIVNRTLLLVLGFIIVVLVGRYFLPTYHGSASSENLQPSVSPQSISTNASVSTSSNPTIDPSVSTCISTLTDETAKAHTEYEKGSLLVTFKDGPTYAEAKEIVAAYGISIKNDPSAKTSFDARRLIIGTFTPGEEFSKICLVRQDSHVKYAGLNVIFNLHE
jgi:hypothetical protein